MRPIPCLAACELGTLGLQSLTSCPEEGAVVSIQSVAGESLNWP